MINSDIFSMAINTEKITKYFKSLNIRKWNRYEVLTNDTYCSPLVTIWCLFRVFMHFLFIDRGWIYNAWRNFLSFIIFIQWWYKTYLNKIVWQRNKKWCSSPYLRTDETFSGLRKEELNFFPYLYFHISISNIEIYIHISLDRWNILETAERGI